MFSFSLKRLNYILLLGSLSLCQGDWLEDTGMYELCDYLNVTSLPTELTAEVPINMVEAGGSYLPSGFTGINIINASNTSNGISGHASTVAGNYFAPIITYAGGVSKVYCYGATNFQDEYLDGMEYFTVADGVSKSGYYLFSTGKQVHPMQQRVSSHAYSGGGGGYGLLSKFDYLASEGNTLMVAALNNGAGSSIPVTWAHTYNSVSVGMTNGGHSTGDTTSRVYGVTAGRTKPEIVSSASTTSWATGQVSSGATHLYGTAQTLSATDASFLKITENTQVQRAILLAGATKEEFPHWQNAASDPTGKETRPLDPTYGAGEMNVFNSHRIIKGGTPATSRIGYHGWDYDHLGNNAERTYTFTVPQEVSSARFSSVLCWNREVNESSNFYYSYETLRDLNLELSGGTLSSPMRSNGSLDNLEHIYAASLGPGKYTLTVSQAGGATQAYGLAWRLNVIPLIETPSTIPLVTGISLAELIPGMRYEIWESKDLSSWSYVDSFTPTTNTYIWDSPNRPEGESGYFYCIKHWN